MNYAFNRMHVRHWLFLPALLLLSLTCWADNLTATVDRTELSRGETLELQVRYDGQTTSDPDFSVLETDFEILGQHQQNQFSILNGSTESYTQWTLQLLPKNTGSVAIPSLHFKGVASDPIVLQVEPRTTSNSTSKPVFIETELSTSSVYVQEQVLLTLRLNTSVPLQGLSSEELMIKDVELLKVSENQYQRRANGKLYQVVELKYALFPEASGELLVPPVRFKAMIPDRRDPFSGSLFGSRGKPVFLLSDEQRIDVKPRPSSYGNGDWLPTRGLSLSERWSRPLDELVAGEPVTRTIHMTAQGLMDNQLPPLTMVAGDGYRVYPDQPQLENTVDSDGVMGSRVESIAIVPSREGKITLPPVVVQWWDTNRKQMRETVLEGHTLNVKPAQGIAAPPAQDTAPTISTSTGTAPPSAATSNSQVSVLVWVLLTLNLLLLIAVVVLFLLWRSNREPSQETNASGVEAREPALFKALCQRAKDGTLHPFREALLLWASAYWQRSLLTLTEIADAANQKQITDSLEKLDRSLYSPDLADKVDLDQLCEQLKTLRKAKPHKPPKGSGLEPLYGGRRPS